MVGSLSHCVAHARITYLRFVYICCVLLLALLSLSLPRCDSFFSVPPPEPYHDAALRLGDNGRLRLAGRAVGVPGVAHDAVEHKSPLLAQLARDAQGVG